MKTVYKQALVVGSILLVAGNARAQLTPLSVGTINPGDSVVIYYDVTINTGAGSQVTNQGTVSGANVSTFSTDDPDTAPIGDATVSRLNMFPLPVTLYSLTAVGRNGGVELNWNVAAESNMLRYEVERSADGRSFSKIGEVAALNGQQPAYHFFDGTASQGVFYYRLQLIDRLAAGRYSAVVKVDLVGRGGSVAVYPNPAAQRQLTLQLSNMDKGAYQLKIYNNAGLAVYHSVIQHGGGSLSRGISLPQGLSAGLYVVSVGNDAVSFRLPLLIN